MRYLLTLLLLTGCEINGRQKVDVGDSVQTVETRGEAYQYVVVRLEFISQVKELCEDKLLASDFESDELYRQAVANCTFENLNLLNISLPKVDAFGNEFCKDGADLSGLTPEQLEQVKQLCEVM